MSTPCALSAVFGLLPTLLPLHWRRQRGSLGPSQVMLSLMVMSVMGCKGYARTLREMKTYLSEALRWERACRAPTGQALSQARRKLTPARCREVVAQVHGMCTTARSAAALGYGGMRVLALDGTKLALPAYRALREHYGCPTQSPMGPQASFTLLWDVGANQPVDWQVGPYRVCERVHAQDLIAALAAGDLVLADRNFACRRVMFALHQRRADWLMRVRCSGSGTLVEVEAFVASGRIEQALDLVLRDHRGEPAAGTPIVPSDCCAWTWRTVPRRCSSRACWTPHGTPRKHSSTSMRHAGV